MSQPIVSRVFRLSVFVMLTVVLAGTIGGAPMVASADAGPSEAVTIISVDFTEGEGCLDFPKLCARKDGRLVPSEGVNGS